LFSVLNNGISDKDLLRKIDFGSTDENLSNIYVPFIKGDFETATNLLFDFYKNDTVFTPFEERTEEELDFVIGVNLKGPILMTQAVFNKWWLKILIISNRSN